jgi:hypothetical protein
MERNMEENRTMDSWKNMRKGRERVILREAFRDRSSSSSGAITSSSPFALARSALRRRITGAKVSGQKHKGTKDIKAKMTEIQNAMRQPRGELETNPLTMGLSVGPAMVTAEKMARTRFAIN